MNRSFPLLAVVLAMSAAWLAQGRSAPAAAQASSESSQEKALESGVGMRLVRAFAHGKTPADLQILFATVPDARASHLDWVFDSHVDALRRAFERAGYVLDRFELPWKSTDDSRKPPELARIPGAMLFRESAQPQSDRPGGDDARLDPLQRRVWLVYLIGELSTGGIDTEAFEAAAKERNVLAPRAKDLLLVGPVFSGTSPSLRVAIANCAELRETEHVHIVSGAATSPNNGSILSFGSKPVVTFASTLHTDDVLLDVLKTELLPGLGLEPSEVAVFRESTTDYGQSTLSSTAQNGTAQNKAAQQPGATASDGSKFVVVPFPMSLASLRSAYFKDNKTGETTPIPGKVASANVVLDLGAEPERLETASSASLLTPASIDLLMDEMTRMMSQRGVRAALLLASDVRDKVFLAIEIKKRLPDVQLFTFEGNVLYLRPEYNRWLRSMVVLSTYPLLLRDSSWRPQSHTSAEQLLFSNEGAEGTFNAVLVQLGKSELVTDYCPPVLHPPKSRDDETRREIPPVWATVVGAGMMLPLGAFMPTNVMVGSPMPCKIAVADEGGNDAAKRSNFLVVTAVSILSLLLIGKVVSRRARHAMKRGLRARILQIELPATTAPWVERTASLHRISLAIHHEIYVALVCITLIGLILPHVVLLCISPGAWNFESRGLPVALGALAVLAGVIELCISAWNAFSTAFAHRKLAFDLRRDWPSEAGPRFAWWSEFGLRVIVSLMGLAYLGLQVWMCVHFWQSSRSDASDPTLFRLFAHRALEVDQGISPLVPMFLIGIAVLVWCQWHILRIRALAHAEVGEAAWAALSSDASVHVRDVRERLFRVVPDKHAIALMCALAIGFAWMYLQVERTFDGYLQHEQHQWRAFDFAFKTGILAALAASAWAAYRLLSVWRAFSMLLRDAAPALAHLPFKAVRLSRGVRASLGLWPAMEHADFDGVARDMWKRLAGHLNEMPPGVRATISADSIDQADVTHKREDVLRADSIAGRALTAWMSSAAGSDPKSAWFAAGRQLFAVESLVYTEWVLGHMRRLSFFLVLSVVLTTLLISSYPFQPQTLFSTISFFVFAGVVAVLLWVIGSVNRNASLSRMSGSTPGELTWDRTLFGNLALYFIVPAITLASAQFPALRETLFKWVEPVAKFVVSA